MVSTVASQEEGSIPGWVGPFRVEFACSPCLHGFPLSSPASSHSPNTCRLTGDSKLSVGVNGCLSLYDSPVLNW